VAIAELKSENIARQLGIMESLNTTEYSRSNLQYRPAYTKFKQPAGQPRLLQRLTQRLSSHRHQSHAGWAPGVTPAVHCWRRPDISETATRT